MEKSDLLLRITRCPAAKAQQKRIKTLRRGTAMRRMCLLVGIIVASSSLAGVTERGAASERPNIIIVLADDMGYGDCGVYNPESRIATPNIDQLAKEGLRFSDAHSAGSTCTPSRYGLLTGINPARTGVLNTLLGRGNPIIDEDETT
ncbi:MAG: sulfatase-like hydrolase/transferase, partial [Sedimentisphaerales bacterium]|nr:sulfatase-like hydrolase/transferase [Sedimentisphaerales bacterium]